MFGFHLNPSLKGCRIRNGTLKTKKHFLLMRPRWWRHSCNLFFQEQTAGTQKKLNSFYALVFKQELQQADIILKHGWLFLFVPL